MKYFILLSVLAMLAGCEASSEMGTIETMTPRIEYWSNLADEMWPMTLTVAPDGEAELTVLTNGDNPAVNHIGIYRGEVRPDQVSALAEAVQSPDFLALREPEGLAPGQVSRYFRSEFDSGQSEQRTVGEESPQAFKKAEGIALAIAGELRSRPALAIGLRLPEPPGRFFAGDELAIAVEMVNVGSGPIRMPYPASWQNQGVECVLKAVRSDVPPAEISGAHQYFLHVVGDAIRFPAPSSSGSEHVVLAPGDKLAFRIVVRPDWSIGSYDSQISIAISLTAEDGNHLLRGELVSPTLALECVSGG